MASPQNNDAFGAAKIAYREQTTFGSSSRTALDLATIVYQQRNPCVPTAEVYELVAEMLGLTSA